MLKRRKVTGLLVALGMEADILFGWSTAETKKIAADSPAPPGVDPGNGRNRRNAQIRIGKFAIQVDFEQIRKKQIHKK